MVEDENISVTGESKLIFTFVPGAGIFFYRPRTFWQINSRWEVSCATDRDVGKIKTGENYLVNTFQVTKLQ